MTPYVGTLPVEEIPNSSSLRNYETPTQPTNNTPVQNTEPTPSNNGNNDSPSSTPSSNSGDSGGHHTSGSSSSGDTTSSNSNDLVNSEIDTPLTPPTVNTGTGNSGGGYYGDSGFKGESTTITDTTDEDIVNSIIDSTGTSIKIPTSSKSLDSITTSKKKNSVPIAASLGAAAIAGIGAKTFMDTKEDDDEEDEENEEEFVKESESNNNEGFALGYSEDEDSAERDYIVPTDEWAFIDGQE